MKEKTSSPPLKSWVWPAKCVHLQRVSMYVSTLEFAGNGPKRGNGPRCVLCVQNARQTPVQNGVLGLEKQLQLFLLFYAPKWPLLSIHTLKSAMPVTKWRFRTRKASVIFLLNKDGGVFNALKINESQQTGVENYESMSHVLTFVWSWNKNSQILTRIRCPSNGRHS